MTAARDLGLRAGSATNTDYLVTSWMEHWSAICSARRSALPGGRKLQSHQLCSADPNYHNDVTDRLVGQLLGLAVPGAAADGSIGVLVDPTDDVGRLKVFSVTLQYTSSVPEGSSLWLLVIAMSLWLSCGGTRHRPQDDGEW